MPFLWTSAPWNSKIFHLFCHTFPVLQASSCSKHYPKTVLIAYSLGSWAVAKVLGDELSTWDTFIGLCLKSTLLPASAVFSMKIRESSWLTTSSRTVLLISGLHFCRLDNFSNPDIFFQDDVYKNSTLLVFQIA